MQKVVILGGGFGGLLAAQALRGADAEVTLVDFRNFHLFQPLLYQVATGSLAPGEIAEPLRSILSKQKNAKVLLGRAVDLDAQARTVTMRYGEETDAPGELQLPYDALIVATGAQNSYFGNSEWPKFAPALKSVEDATAMRHKILYAFEAAEREPDPARRRTWLTFVIVGAGPTGVELAGALAEIARETLRHDFRTIRPEESRILLLEGSPHVLPTYSKETSIAAERALIRLGVLPRTSVRVTGIDQEGVTLSTGERIESKTVLWAAGVTTSDFAKVLEQRAGATLDRQGRVIAAPDLTIPGHPEIFVIGDLAHVESNGREVPGVAPAAMQMGRYAARTLIRRWAGRPTPPFHYLDKGSLAVIGRGAAVMEIGRWRFHGFLAWLLWLFIHLMYLVEFRNRLIVFIRWGFQYLSFERGARLITAMRH
ncbi:MAG TPA: NAD(P)/FAD-dependent oxidoreductase [Bryobacteraceae bacterium]|jgi:NADH dehydrogenase|nr:NAD(P)/FAD-dependent oxidoreductase [Bryobacteraceae bacterium]